MRTLLLIATGFTLFSCSTPDLNEDYKQSKNYTNTECGIIRTLTDSPNGDQMGVKMQSGERHTYSIPDYNAYTVGAEICDFTGLVELQ